MNIVILTGNLTNDVEVKANNDGVKFAVGTVAVRRNYGKKETDFIKFVGIGIHAEYLEKYGKKGARIEITGCWQHNTFKTKDGKSLSEDKCVINDAKITSKIINNDTPTPTSAPSKDIDDDDLPF